LTFFDEQLKKGSFQICHCKKCEQNIWPPNETCHICNEETEWSESMYVGKIIEFSKKDSLYFGIIELKENIRIMGEIHSTKEPKIGQNVTMKAFFDTRPHYLFTVENN